MTWLIFFASSLSAFRLTRLVTNDKITDFIRRFVRRKAPKKVEQGVECPFCVSAYWSLIIAVLLWRPCDVITLLWIPFWWTAIWGASVTWNQVFMALTKEAE